MTVKYYVGKNRDMVHEAMPITDIIKQIHYSYNHLFDTPCVVMANIDKPAKADLVIVTDKGLGVIELKHVPGRISEDKESHNWFFEKELLNAGNHNKHGNPNEQVRKYARSIRYWVRKKFGDDSPKWNPLKIQTAVCFTHEAADFSALFELYPKSNVDFQILKPDQIVQWIAGLRFGNVPLKLTTQQLEHEVVKEIFGVMEWQEIEPIVEKVWQPFGYLQLDDVTFPLMSRQVKIGKKAESCTVIIPKSFRRVSRVHAQIEQKLGEIVLTDLGSKNGIFVNDGKRITQATALRNGDKIALGGPGTDEKSCLLEFSLEPPTSSARTEVRTQTQGGLR